MKLKKLIGLILCTSFMVVGVGCGNDGGSNDEQESSWKNPEPIVLTGETIRVGEDELPYSEEEIYNQLFDINNRVEISLDIDEEELSKMQQDYEEYSARGSKSPIYREASISIKIVTDTDAYVYYIDEVGVRMKGNTSRCDFFDWEYGKYNLINLKVDFRGTFATLEKLDFKWNKNDDNTYLREYYAYKMFRDNGILAPQMNLTSMNISGVHEGVFMIYEPVDKIFIERNISEADQGGDLYKCGWTYGPADFTYNATIGIEDEETAEFYNYDLKTNKKSSNHEQLNRLIQGLNSGNVRKTTIEELVDIDYFLRYEAVAYCLGNPDDLRNNYNNYYIYFMASTGKMIIIPYDYDRCLGVGMDWNPNGDVMTDVNPFSNMALGMGGQQMNPLYIYTVDRGGYFINEFADALDTVISEGIFDYEEFEKIYNIAQSNYRTFTSPDKEFLNAEGYSFAFDINTSEGFYSSSGNASVSEYMQAKEWAYHDYMDVVEDNSSDFLVPAYYIRGSFNGWSVDEDYLMDYNENTGEYRFVIELDGESALKVNNGVDGQPGLWFGYEDIEEFNASGNVQTDHNGNIVLGSGEYEIIFNPESQKVIIN